MALIPPFFIDCVVAIGADDEEGQRRWIASGFFYGHLVTAEEQGEKKYRIYLVTNRHVFEGLKLAYVRLNPRAEEEEARGYELALVDEKGNPLWSAHPKAEADVAVVAVKYSVLLEEAAKVAFFQSDHHVASIDKMNELGITEGDFAYVLGFPLGIVGDKRNYVVARSGTIARIRDTLAKANDEFLVDAFIFPGNSGGPVVSKPELTSIKGTKSQTAAYLIGIVKSYVPYQDIAVSVQTKRPRVVFEENSGLAAAHPIDFAQEAIAEHIKKTSG